MIIGIIVAIIIAADVWYWCKSSKPYQSFWNEQVDKWL